MSSRIMVGLAAFLFGSAEGSAQTMAPAHPSFSGVFVVDLEASDSLDALLQEMGRSLLERKAAGSLSVTHTVTHTGDTMTIGIDSVLKSRTEVLKLDGSPTQSEGLDGRTIDVRSRFSDDGASVVTEADLAAGNGNAKAKKLVVVRSLEDGGKTLRQLFKLTKLDGTVLSVNRIFRRR